MILKKIEYICFTYQEFEKLIKEVFNSNKITIANFDWKNDVCYSFYVNNLFTYPEEIEERIEKILERVNLKDRYPELLPPDDILKIVVSKLNLPMGYYLISVCW